MPEQYTSIRYTDRLAEAGVAGSIGSIGDAYDNAMAETLNGAFKTELINRRTWRRRDDVEPAVVEWIGWYNQARLHEALGYVPPLEYEHSYRSAFGQLTLPGTT